MMATTVGMATGQNCDLRLSLSTEFATDFASTKVHVCVAFAWEISFRTVSSIGRASDS